MGQHVAVVLRGDEGKSLFIPEGFAHGFLTLEPTTIVYHLSRLHSPGSEWSISWQDPSLAIDWPLTEGLILSARDRDAPNLADVPSQALLV